VRKKITCFEAYPVFGVDDPHPDDTMIIDLSEEQLADYLRVCDEFDRWQKILSDALDAAGN
jgi:hypothetical protein